MPEAGIVGWSPPKSGKLGDPAVEPLNWDADGSAVLG